MMNVSTFLTFLTCTGCWRPLTWTTPLKTVIYNSYSAFFVLSSVAFSVSGIGSLFAVETVDEFVENTYILTSAVCGCCKMMNVLLYRKRILNLINVFLTEPCAASNTNEAEIQLICDSRLWKNAIGYTIMIQSSVTMNIFNSFMTNYQDKRLTYRAWIPYDYKAPVVFPLTFTFQLLCVLLLSLIHVATDILFVGMLMQLNCQFEILLSRLNNVRSDTKASLQRIVRHHERIYQLADMINDALNLIIVSQFLGSFLVLCLSLIQLLKADVLSTEFLATIFYLSTILLQTFLYCWYGNEVKLKSMDLADAIFQIDWTELNEEAKKILLIAMNRTLSPIEFESAHVVTVNINFFVNLLKSSYSFYNVLQSSGK